MNNVPFSFVHRIGNRVAHKLAQFAVTLVHDVSWELDSTCGLKNVPRKIGEQWLYFVTGLGLSSFKWNEIAD